MNIFERLKFAADNKRQAPSEPVEQPKDQAAPVQPKSGCGGCQNSWFDKVLDFGEAVTDVTVYAAKMTVGMKVSQEEHDKRKEICENCTVCDSKGDRLNREIKPGVISCGIPRTSKPFRLSEVDGCGCWLNLKWWGQGQKCPLKEPRW